MQISQNINREDQEKYKIRFNKNLIWIDADVDGEENRKYQIRLNDIFNKCFYIDSIENYSNHFNSPNINESEKYFIIVSGSFGEKLIDSIDQQLNVEEVFVICSNMEKYRQWAKQHSKVKSVENNIESIMQCLQRHYYLQSYQDIGYKQAFHFTGTKQFINYIDIDFILKLVCMAPQARENSLREFEEFSIDYICQKYHNQEVQLEFELQQLQALLECMQNENDNQTEIISWYTYECFFYRMINEILRGGDIIKIFQIRFGIYLLYSQLKNQAKQQKYKQLTLYRGCVIDRNEFQLWEKEKQPFMMQGFISTSASKKVAIDFIEEALQRIPSQDKKNNIKILIEIEIQQQYLDKNITYPVAINNFSNYQIEDEYLLQLNTFVQVKRIQQEKNFTKITVELTSLDFNSLGLNQVTLDRKKQVDEILQKNYSKEHFYLSHYFQETYNKFKIKIIMDKLTADKNLTPHDKSLKYNFTGIALKDMGNYKQALESFQKSIETQKQYTVGDDILIINTYMNIHNILLDQGQILESMVYLNKCTELINENPDLGNINVQMGLFYINLGEHINLIQSCELEYEQDEITIFEKVMSEILQYKDLILQIDVNIQKKSLQNIIHKDQQIKTKFNWCQNKKYYLQILPIRIYLNLNTIYYQLFKKRIHSRFIRYMWKNSWSHLN